MAAESDQTQMDVLIEQLLDRAEELENEAERHIYEIHDRGILEELTPWMRRTGWIARFDGRNMKVLNDLLSEPKRNMENQAKLRSVWESVERVMKQCWDSVNDCWNRDWKLILYWLASDSKTEADAMPFSIYMDRKTRKRYTEYWQQFMMFVLRGLDDANHQYGIEYTELQKRALDEINKELQKDHIIEDDLDKKVTTASLLFIKHSNFAKPRSALLYFTGVVGFHVGWKRWKGPADYTTILAGLQWVLRILLLESAIPKEDRDEWDEKYRDDPLQRFRQNHDRFLVAGEPYPYDQIHSLLNYGMKASINVTTRSRIGWSADASILYLDGRPRKMEKWKRLFLF
jgi:hypothetical protein